MYSNSDLVTTNTASSDTGVTTSNPKKIKNTAMLEQHKEYYACFLNCEAPDIERAITIYETPGFPVTNEFMLFAITELCKSLIYSDDNYERLIGLFNKLIINESVQWQEVLGIDLYKRCCEKHLNNIEYSQLYINPGLKNLLQAAVIANDFQAVAGLLERGAPIHYITNDQYAINGLPLSTLSLAIHSDNSEENSSGNAVEIIYLLLQKNKQLKEKGSRNFIKSHEITLGIELAIILGAADYLKIIFQELQSYDATELTRNLYPLVIEHFMEKGRSCFDASVAEEIAALFDPNVTSEIRECYQDIIAQCSTAHGLSDFLKQLENCIRELKLSKPPISGYQFINVFQEDKTVKNGEADIFDYITKDKQFRKKTLRFFEELMSLAQQKIESLSSPEKKDTIESSSKKSTVKKQRKKAKQSITNQGVSGITEETQEPTADDSDVEIDEEALRAFAGLDVERPKAQRIKPKVNNKKPIDPVRDLEKKQQSEPIIVVERSIPVVTQKIDPKQDHPRSSVQRPRHPGLFGKKGTGAMKPLFDLDRDFPELPKLDQPITTTINTKPELSEPVADVKPEVTSSSSEENITSKSTQLPAQALSPIQTDAYFEAIESSVASSPRASITSIYSSSSSTSLMFSRPSSPNLKPTNTQVLHEQAAPKVALPVYEPQALWVAPGGGLVTVRAKPVVIPVCVGYEPEYRVTFPEDLTPSEQVLGVNQEGTYVYTNKYR